MQKIETLKNKSGESIYPLTSTKAVVDENGNTIENRLVVADGEDLVTDGNVLRLKDRPNTDGMGYVILRKDKTFQEQVTKPNTIYEIRYDFDLGRQEKTVVLDTPFVLPSTGGAYYRTGDHINVEAGMTVDLPSGGVLFDSTLSAIIPAPYTASSKKSLYVGKLQSEATLGQSCVYSLEKEVVIPENCVLKFEGGSLGNGTVVLSKHNIISNESNSCVFDKVKFTGNVYATAINISWLVNKSYETDGIQDNTTIDSAVGLNEAFACGLKKFIFPSNKYYHLKSPIVINGDIQVFSDGKDERFRELSVFMDYTNYAPCIYSNEIVSMLEYNFTTEKTQKGITIAGMRFLVRKKFTEINDNTKETPIVTIRNLFEGAALWGIDFNCSIMVIPQTVKVWDNYPEHRVANFAGVKLISEKSPITYVRLNGYMGNVFYQVLCDTKESWITDIYLNGDAFAVSGYKHIGGNYKPSPIIVNGSIQTSSYWTDENYKSHAYFEGCPNVIINGYLWDLGASGNNGFRTVGNPFFVNIKGQGVTNQDSIYIDELDYSGGNALQDHHLLSSYNKFLLFDNLLEQGKYDNNFAVSDLVYKIGEKDIIKEEYPDNIYNVHKLFTVASYYSSGNRVNKDACYFLNNEGNNKIEISFTIKNSILLLGERAHKIPLFIKSSNSYKWDVVVNYYKDNTIIHSKNYSVTGSYYSSSGWAIDLLPRAINEAGSFNSIKVSIVSNTYPDVAIYENTPLIFIPGVKKTSIDSFTELPTIVEGGYYHCFSKKEKKPTWWNGTKWVNSQGKSIDETLYVTTETRPKTPEVGEYKYNIETHLPEWWDGTRWATFDVRADALRRGDSSSRPSDLLKREVYTYFNTEKTIPEFYINGIWVEADGTHSGIPRKGIEEELPTEWASLYGTTGFLFYDAGILKPLWYAGYSRWHEADGVKAYTKRYGTSEERPLAIPVSGIKAGFQYFDTTLNMPIWWNGSAWVEGGSQKAGIQRAGTWSQRPNADGSFLDNGFQYFLLESEPDEDPDGNPMEGTTGNGKPIWWIQESRKWVDATGATVTG